MILKGEKRKVRPEDQEVLLGWENQRQLVLSLSFIKHQHGQELLEPSLRRQVLIANTLRQLSALVPENQVPPSDDDEEDWGSMSAEPDFEVTAAVASILTALDAPMDGGPQVGLRAPLRALENLLEPGWDKAAAQAYGELWENKDVEVMRFGSLGDVTVEELFHDIDTSLLQSDGGGEDLLRCLPPLVPSPIPPPSANHCFDLDHLMEVLVKS
ncbi:SERTA domain-containing protein 3 [Gouania willdenowi]|nr:SERTA domain-containing protein 3 [Gouania willdenowi]